jgi:hypothetical protein
MNYSSEDRHHALTLFQSLERSFNPGFHLPNPEDFEITPKVPTHEPSISSQLKIQKDLDSPVS